MYTCRCKLGSMRTQAFSSFILLLLFDCNSCLITDQFVYFCWTIDSYDDVKKYFKPCDVIFNFNCIGFTGTPFLDKELPYSTPTYIWEKRKDGKQHDCCEYILTSFFSSWNTHTQLTLTTFPFTFNSIIIVTMCFGYAIFYTGPTFQDHIFPTV